MIILKFLSYGLFSVVFFYYVITTFHRLIFPYVAISYHRKGMKKHVDLFILFEIISIIGLLFLALIIDEKQFIFNFKDAFIWLVGIFVFLCIHLQSVFFIYNFFRKK